MASSLRSTTFSLQLLCATILLVIGWGSAHAQAVVTTQDGFVFRGKIVARGLDSLILVTDDGKRVSLPYLQVRTVEEVVAADESPHARPPAEERVKDNAFVGAAFNTPLIMTRVWLTLMGGLRMDRFGARLSLILRDREDQGLNGAEFDLFLNIDENRYATADFYVGIGIGPNIDLDGWEVAKQDRRYTAIGLNLNLAGVYVSGAVTFGEGSNPQSYLQVGYMFEAGRVSIFDYF